MKEADLVQAVATWINLSYTAGQWWITVTTALLVATYFAARHIPPWFFAVILLLYLLTALSVVLEFAHSAHSARSRRRGDSESGGEETQVLKYQNSQIEMTVRTAIPA